MVEDVVAVIRSCVVSTLRLRGATDDDVTQTILSAKGFLEMRQTRLSALRPLKRHAVVTAEARLSREALAEFVQEVAKPFRVGGRCAL